MRGPLATVYNIDMLDLVAEGNAILLPVKVVPGASRTRYLGEWDSRAKIAVTAPPEKGKANQAVTRLLADLLGVRRRDVSVATGHTSSVKTVRIEGVTIDTVSAALQPPRS
jgi:uncharacterized protein (TIGR00251 family)